jgi:hypothetical protein
VTVEGHRCLVHRSHDRYDVGFCKELHESKSLLSS